MDDYCSYSVESELPVIWDTIITGFIASREQDMEVCPVPNGEIIDGYTSVEIKLPKRVLIKRLEAAIKRADLDKTACVVRRNGKVFLHKVGNDG